MQIHIRSTAIHELGKRSNQEDSLYPPAGSRDQESPFFLVCDGMGGHEHGEIASQMVVKAFATSLNAHWDGEMFTDEIFQNALNEAFNSLDTINDNTRHRPGTTLTFLCFHRGGAYAAHLGDSRIYHIRPSKKEILYKSRDHSQVYDLFVSGELTLDEMKDYPHKNIITRALMPHLERRPKAGIAHMADIEEGDYFYLCSDGMLEKMDDDELVDILAQPCSDQEKKEMLLEATKENKDNHSAYLLNVLEVIYDEGDDLLPNDELTTRSNALIYERFYRQTRKETGRIRGQWAEFLSHFSKKQS
ncbi:MAG: serine/threonine-protein phosphatase [Prevotella sp.]|nr:serine/threonine-protein phosphatase [Prevotella sp.]